MEKDKGDKKLYIILESASLETAKIGKQYELLNCDKHKAFMKKFRKNPVDYRPDITHQCLLMLLDSPLNRAGRLRVFIHTAKNVLIEISPQTRIPRTFDRFCGLMVQLLHKLTIRSNEGSERLLKVIKNPVSSHLPAGCVKLATSCHGQLVDPLSLAPPLKPAATSSDGDASEASEGAVATASSVAIVVGAMAHGSVQCDYTERTISISGYPLSAALTCAKICDAFERAWEIR